MSPTDAERYRNLKTLNRRAALDMIRFTPGGISRAQIARQMLLSRSAVSTIIGDLVDMKLVVETESGPRTGGRRPILLAIKPQYGHAVGIDMGVTHLGIVVTNFAGDVLEEIEYPFSIADGPQECLAKISQHLSEALVQLGLSVHQISAVGIGIPGPVITETGELSSPSILPEWGDFPIRTHLEELWQVPVSVANDAELGAVGEWAYGAGRGESNLVYIKVGTGVGSGLLLDGHIYRGTSGCAGEIGHITIQENGPLCSCGNYGCLEAVAGGRAIARKAQEAIATGKRTQLSTIEPDKLLAYDVADAAQHGDLLAQQIITEAGMNIGIAVASLINLFNPKLVVVGGGISRLGDLLLDPMREIVMERSLRAAAKVVRITSAVLGRRASSMGAVVQAINLSLDRL